MAFFGRFRDNGQGSTASLAKERLKVIVAHERQQRNQPDYLPAMQNEILAVIRKYIPITSDDVHIHVENEGQVSILELNVTLPE